MIEKISVDFVNEDNRGKLVQLVRRGYSQVNVISSKKGVIRGGHYHKLNTEAFYIIEGSCVVKVKDGEEYDEEKFSKDDFFRISPGVLHSFEYLEDTIMVSMYSLGVELDDGEKDMYSINQ